MSGGGYVAGNYGGSPIEGSPVADAAPAIIIRLEPHEFLQAALIGAQNQLYKYEHKIPHHASVDLTHETEIYQHSARSEMAMSKWLQTYYDGHVSDKGAKDVAGYYQLRSTPVASGHLILRSIDRPEDPYVLAIVSGLEVRLVGWMWGEFAKTEKYHRVYRNTTQYWVPQQNLVPMSYLPNFRHGLKMDLKMEEDNNDR